MYKCDRCDLLYADADWTGRCKMIRSGQNGQYECNGKIVKFELLVNAEIKLKTKEED